MDTLSPTELLKDLIALPSVNPAFMPGNSDWTGETRMVAYLEKLGKKAGLRVKKQKAAPGRENILLSGKPSGKITQRVVFAPHLDTVPPHDPKQLTPTIAGGKLFGRGACDTKGSAAAMLWAILQVEQHRNTEVIFAGLADEEDGQRGSRALTASGFRADLVIVGEPTSLRLVTAHKGDLWLNIETHGKAAHGARPELGINAVHEMARVVEVVSGSYAKAIGRRVHPLVGPATVNIGSIRGGNQPNIVPDECIIQIDRRTLPGEKDAAVIAELRKHLKEAGLKAEVINTKNATCFPMETTLTNPLVQQFARSINSTEPLGVDYFCDASVFAAVGIPSVVFGPGDIAHAHTATEFVPIAELETAARKLLKFLQTLP